MSRFFFWLTLVSISLSTMAGSFVHADDDQLKQPNEGAEVRYTCRNQTIDIHLLKYTDPTEVTAYNADWLGTKIPWEHAYKVKKVGDGAILEKATPVTRNCDLWSGTYIVTFGAWWWDSHGDSEVWPTFTITHDGKEVIPTTVLGMCEKGRSELTRNGDCTGWAVRVFLFEAVDSFRNGKPIGINKPNVTLYRVVKDTFIAK